MVVAVIDPVEPDAPEPCCCDENDAIGVPDDLLKSTCSPTCY